ncbi:carbamoyltransferase [Amylibacter sp.]|nr:carbamoyltransferase [Amylibacter sp.]MDC1292432.1 carbamoyltransferase [Amylibacter sp.]MDC1532057.1 carbamoyltransferase [Amylibacter sp.]
MYILGISSFYHDSAACLINGDEIVAAAQEERFTRKKHDASFPKHAIKYCLREAGITAEEITNVVFYEKPFLKFERLLETYLAFAPKGFKSFSKAMPIWIKDKLFQKRLIIKELKQALSTEIDWIDKLHFSEHHLSHAASAFYPSPFKTAAILTLDGVGEWTTSSIAIGNGKEIKLIKELHFPHSLGLLYSAFTYYIGFKVNSGEYKMMGLAPYGEAKYVDIIKDKLINIADDGSFQLNMKYFNFATGLTMTNNEFDALFEGPPRKSEMEITQREMDIAASIQKVIEDVIVKLGKNISIKTGEKNLCLAGGVALNCVANGVLLREGIFDNIWIQPAAGDAGGALGAALSLLYIHHDQDRKVLLESDMMKGAYLGPKYNNKEIKAELTSCGAKFVELSTDNLLKEVVNALVSEKAIGWMQGRMEFGPRALGARSIIADPRSPIMQKQLNIKVKYRESFRPFAPSVLREDVSEWFEHDVDSPYMLFVADVQKIKRRTMALEEEELFGIDKLNVCRSLVPAITHIDYSSRIQTVHYETNPLYHSLISRFKDLTGCSLLINTSFNVRGEPIVCTTKDAFKCFMGTDLDVLAVGDFILYKEDQDKALRENYKNQFELD